MRFASKIAVAQGAVVLAAGAVALTMLTTLTANRSVLREISDSYEQTLSVTRIAQMSDNYSEQIAEHIILGPDSAEAQAARDSLLATIGQMEAQVGEEIEELREENDLEEIAEEQLELDRMTGLREAVVRLEIARLRMVSVLEAGDTQTAIDIYIGEIEDGLDTELDQLTEESVVREQGEVIEALAESQIATKQLRWIAGMLGLIALVGAMMLSTFLHRAVLRPVARLGEGFAAVAKGDLNHRIALDRTDEFGDMADGFNRMTAEIAAQRSGLERQVAERTNKLTAALTALETQSEQRSRFLADISHELRTPLTILRGRVEVALRDPDLDADGLRAVLDRTVGTAQRLGRLVDDLLFLARSEAGTIPIERGPVILQDVLADTLLDSRELARTKQVFLLPQQPAEPIEITGDADRLRQALLILLDNAVEAAPEGSTVTVTLDATGDGAEIAVTDEGPGFTEAQIAEPSGRFRTSRGNGTGLGLSIAAWVMQGHGGALRLANAPDGGAVARLWFPEIKA